MARVKSIRWQLLLLMASWTTFICCVLYASRMNAAPHSSAGKPMKMPPSRVKRFSGDETQGKCLVVKQTKDDETILEYVVNRSKQRPAAPSVHCTVTTTCNQKSPYLADCHSTLCSQFNLRVKNSNRVIPSLHAAELSEMMTTILAERSFATVSDLNDDIDVQCLSPSTSKLTITGDILPNPRCSQGRHSRLVQDEKGKDATSKSIHVFYFRFLSQWEFPIRFPISHAFLHSSSGSKRASTLVFDKHQATQWDDDEVLSLFLQGLGGPLNNSLSLPGVLHKAGSCFRLRDLSCGRSRQQEGLVWNVTSEEGGCAGRSSSPRQAAVDRLCQDGNWTDSETRQTLTALLLDVHGLADSSASDQPLVSVSVLNTKDFRSVDVVDVAVRNVLVGLLSDPNRIVVIVSGVGNPAFLRFDNNVRLHTQASNPVMLVTSSGNLSAAAYREASQLNQTVFSMKGVHSFVKTLSGNEILENESPSQSLSGDFQISCRSLNVSPPFSCMCEGQFVDYENDTLMAGFAELAVSLINTQVQRSSLLPPAPILKSPHCSQWRGLSFSNVRAGRHQDKKRLLMDLHLQNEISKDTVIRRTALDMWDMDKVPRAEVLFYDHDASSARHEHLWKSLCVSGDSLDESLASEVHLLKRWSHERHFGHKAIVTHVHDTCLYLLLHDFGDSISVQAANACRDRRYDVTLPLTLVNMVSLNPFPLSARLGHGQKEFLVAIVKVAYTVPTFAYKLFPDFEVTYEE